MNSSDPIDIVTFRPEFRSAFEALNMVWLESYSLLEPTDVEYLQNPESKILDVGGQIFFALRAGEVVGTAAAIPVSKTVIELAKLAVSHAAQGQGIGRRLSKSVIEFAGQQGAMAVVLTSNARLKQAISLYESLGFRHAPMPQDIPYQTADVYMTLELKDLE